MGRLQVYQERVASSASRRDYLKRRLAEEEALLDGCAVDVREAEEAQKVGQEVACLVQQEVHRQVSGVVTRCLEASFDDPYEFRIVFEQKRGKTEARLAFYRGGNEVDPRGAAGGGVLDVAALALRMASLTLTRPRRRKLLVLDEPFKMVSRRNIPGVRDMLERSSKELGVQLLMATHHGGLRAGSVVEL